MSGFSFPPPPRYCGLFGFSHQPSDVALSWQAVSRYVTISELSCVAISHHVRGFLGMTWCDATQQPAFPGEQAKNENPFPLKSGCFFPLSWNGRKTWQKGHFLSENYLNVKFPTISNIKLCCQFSKVNIWVDNAGLIAIDEKFALTSKEPGFCSWFWAQPVYRSGNKWSSCQY